MHKHVIEVVVVVGPDEPTSGTTLVGQYKKTRMTRAINPKTQFKRKELLQQEKRTLILLVLFVQLLMSPPCYDNRLESKIFWG